MCLLCEFQSLDTTIEQAFSLVQTQCTSGESGTPNRVFDEDLSKQKQKYLIFFNPTILCPFTWVEAQ